MHAGDVTSFDVVSYFSRANIAHESLTTFRASDVLSVDEIIAEMLKEDEDIGWNQYNLVRRIFIVCLFPR